MDNGGEYLGLAGVFQLGESEIVEVAHDARSDGVSAAPWRTHRAHEVHVNQVPKLSYTEKKRKDNSLCVLLVIVTGVLRHLVSVSVSVSVKNLFSAHKLRH